MATNTSIVNIRHNKADIICDRRSPFGNPFVIGRDGTREDVCNKYASYFYKKLQDPEFRVKVMALKGKRLGCWCRCDPPCGNEKCIPHRCHLQTIVEYLENNP